MDQAPMNLTNRVIYSKVQKKYQFNNNGFIQHEKDTVYLGQKQWLNFTMIKKKKSYYLSLILNIKQEVDILNQTCQRSHFCHIFQGYWRKSLVTSKHQKLNGSHLGKKKQDSRYFTSSRMEQKQPQTEKRETF